MSSAPILPTLTEFRRFAKRGNLIPVSTEMIADSETPVSAFKKISNRGYSFLLESAEKSRQAGRYSFVGARPRIIFESHGREIQVVDESGTRRYTTASDPLHDLEQLMARYRFVPSDAAGESRFYGGAVGCLGYDMVRFFEPNVPLPPTDELRLPEMIFLIAETVLIFDHYTRRLRILSNAFILNDRVDEAYAAAIANIKFVLQLLANDAKLPPLYAGTEAPPAEVATNTPRHDYLRMVEHGLDYIRAGDIFQFVPSQRFQTNFDGDPLTLYRALRFVNPSPYMFCFNFAGRFAIIGSSPEIHVRVMNGRVEVRPIAGTKPRGKNDIEDEANAAALLADPKERAEHLMLVDLARNDLGRVADYGTIEISDFMTIERYSHVMHIVSNVAGRLRVGKTAYDVMRATFPAGTVSGSPKVRAMQIINQFEKSKRGIYGGAIGYFGFDGNHDSCIALRTIVLKDGEAYVQAGAGVVADSLPESEHQECVNKAMGMMAAISRAQAVSREASQT